MLVLKPYQEEKIYLSNSFSPYHSRNHRPTLLVFPNNNVGQRFLGSLFFLGSQQHVITKQTSMWCGVNTQPSIFTIAPITNFFGLR